MPRRNIIPRERRVYVKPEDLAELPKGIHVYRGVYGGLYIDREELRRFKDEIRDKNLLRRLLGGEETEEAASKVVDEEVLKVMEKIDEMDDEEVSEFIEKYVGNRIRPIVKKGMGSIEELEKRLQSINELIALCGEKKKDIKDALKAVRPELDSARKLIDADSYKVDEISEMDIDFGELLHSFPRVTAAEVLEDLVYGYGDIFEEVFEAIQGGVDNVALAWRLSKILYLLMSRTSDEGNYGVSRALEIGLKGIVGGSVRPESKMVYLLAGGEYSVNDIYEKALNYVDEKSLKSWMKIMDEALESDAIELPEKLYRGVNDFERLLLYYNMLKTRSWNGAQFVGNIITSFSADRDIAKEFSPVVIEVDASNVKVFGGWWNAVEEFRSEKEVTVLVPNPIPCKVYDYEGSFRTLSAFLNGQRVDNDDLLTALFEGIYLLNVCAKDLERNVNKDVAVNIAKTILAFVQKNMNMLDEDGRAAVEDELNVLRQHELYAEILGGGINE